MTANIDNNVSDSTVTVLNSARRIYSHLQDEISKNLFLMRTAYSASGDAVRYFENTVKYCNLSQEIITLWERLLESRKMGRQIAVFGAGIDGQWFVLQFRQLLRFCCLIDNYKTDPIDSVTDLPIYSLQKYLDKYDGVSTLYVIRASRESSAQIYKQLLRSGVDDSLIVQFDWDWRNNCSQYFDLFRPRCNESFVDLGCFDGSSAFRFAGWCMGGGV